MLTCINAVVVPGVSLKDKRDWVSTKLEGRCSKTDGVYFEIRLGRSQVKRNFMAYV